MKNNKCLGEKSMSKRASRWIGLILCLGAILLLGVETGKVQAQGGILNKNSMQALAGKPEGKLSFRLQLLAQPAIGVQDNETQAQTLNLPASGPGSLMKNENGELLVYIRLTDTSEANLAALAKVGAMVTHVAEAYRTVTAYIRPTQLSALAKMDIVESVQEALRP